MLLWRAGLQSRISQPVDVGGRTCWIEWMAALGGCKE